MFTKSRFQRLCLVAFIPLIILGIWLTENEIVLPHHSFIDCVELPSHFSCISHTTTREREYEASSTATVKFTHNVILLDGFRNKVFLYERPNEVSEINTNLKIKPESAILLSLPPPGVQKTILNRMTGSCEINHFRQDLWEYYCKPDTLGFFKFQDVNTEKKFQQLRNDISTLNEENFHRELAAKIASAISPIIAFLALSFALLLIKRAKNFVRGTDSKVT